MAAIISNIDLVENLKAEMILEHPNHDLSFYHSSRYT